MPAGAMDGAETPEGLLARLAALGIVAETHHHPPVFTVAESRALRGDLPRAISDQVESPDQISCSRNLDSRAAYARSAEREAFHAIGRCSSGHTKNLFLKPAKGDGPYLLATLAESRQVSVNALARAAGWGKVTMASAEALMATLGVIAGAVTPLGLVNAKPGAVRFAIDRALIEDVARIWVHPLTNAASTGIAPDDLLRFLRHCGHEPEILALGAL